MIESISPGHERHDEQTKLRWYSEFGVPHYWLLNPFDRSMRCLVLRKARGGKSAAYRVDVEGRDEAAIRPSLFPGLVIPLAEVWAG